MWLLNCSWKGPFERVRIAFGANLFSLFSLDFLTAFHLWATLPKVFQWVQLVPFILCFHSFMHHKGSSKRVRLAFAATFFGLVPGSCLLRHHPPPFLNSYCLNSCNGVNWYGSFCVSTYSCITRGPPNVLELHLEQTFWSCFLRHHPPPFLNPYCLNSCNEVNWHRSFCVSTESCITRGPPIKCVRIGFGAILMVPFP